MPRPPRPRYQVFVSSTFTDLEAVRRAVVWALMEDSYIPAGMETFPSGDDRGWKIIQRTINLSDYYILIVGGRYGCIDEDSGMSWTEREYEYAMDESVRSGRRLKVLPFFRDRGHIAATELDEGDEQDVSRKRTKLKEFKEKVLSTHSVKWWSTPEDLCSKVKSALKRQIEEDDLDEQLPPGWYRGDHLPLQSADTLDELAKLSQEARTLRARVAELETVAERSPEFEISLGLTPKKDRWNKPVFEETLTFPAQAGPTLDDVIAFIERLKAMAPTSEVHLFCEKFLESPISSYASLMARAGAPRFLLAVEVVNVGTDVAHDVHVEVRLPPYIVPLHTIRQKAVRDRLPLALDDDDTGLANEIRQLLAGRYRHKVQHQYWENEPPTDPLLLQIRGPQPSPTSGAYASEEEPSRIHFWAKRLLHKAVAVEFVEVVALPSEKRAVPEAHVFCSEWPEMKEITVMTTLETAVSDSSQ